MKHLRQSRVPWVIVALLVLVIIVAVLPCGAFVHGPHETCDLCFLHLVEIPAPILIPRIVELAWVEPPVLGCGLLPQLRRRPRESRGPPERI